MVMMEGFFASKDGGRNWQRSDVQPDALRVIMLLLLIRQIPIVFFGVVPIMQEGLYVSEDAGKTFQRTLTKLNGLLILALLQTVV